MRTKAKAESMQKEIMDEKTYKEMCKTVQGRHELHNQLVEELKGRMNKLMSMATPQNRAKLEERFAKVAEVVSKQGVSFIFDDFCADFVDDKTFARHCQNILLGKYSEYVPGKGWTPLT